MNVNRKHAALQVLLIAAIAILGGNQLMDFSPLNPNALMSTDENAPEEPSQDSEVSGEEITGSPYITLSEDGFSPQKIETVEGSKISVRNTDNRSHVITVEGMDVERELSPSETATIEVEAGDWSLESNGVDGIVTLDINLNNPSE